MSVCMRAWISVVCVSIRIKYFSLKKYGWLSLPWQPSSLQSRHWCRNTPPYKLCQWGYARLWGGVFVNRDIQVKNCLFTKQLFFLLQCLPRPADQLATEGRLSTWVPSSQMEHCLQEIMHIRYKWRGTENSSLPEVNINYLCPIFNNIVYNKHMFIVTMKKPWADHIIILCTKLMVVLVRKWNDV